jgi:hypothetical protein
MKRVNRPITSREYKLMLRVDPFSDRQEGADALWKLVAPLVEAQGGEVTNDVRELDRRVWYLDTPGSELRENKFVLRVREEMEDEDQPFKLTLKHRNTDRYLSASRDVSVSPEAGIKDKYVDTKFEEDVLRDSDIRFAHSTSIRMSECPDLGVMADLVAIFPGLDALDIARGTPIVKVRDFEASEVKRESGKFKFKKKPEVKPCLSFWYPPDERDGPPLVAEFSFDYDVRKKELKRLQDHPCKLERFRLHVVKRAAAFFEELQAADKKGDWFDYAGTTKTMFAYTGRD